MQYICVAGKTVSEKREKKVGEIRKKKKSNASRSKETHLCGGSNSYSAECVHQAFVAQKGKDSSEVSL